MNDKELMQLVTEFCIGLLGLIFVGLVIYAVIAWFWGLF